MIPASLTLVVMLTLAPGLIFAAGYLQPLPGMATAILAALSVVSTVRRTDWRGRPDWLLLATAIATAATLTLVSGIGHFFWQTDDWTVRDAILSDLVRNPWPVSYTLPGGEGLLRAPLGMYLVPALAGKAMGLGAAEAALFAQNAALLALLLYIFAATMPPGRSRWIAMALFVGFCGIDCIPWALRWIEGDLPKLWLPHIDVWSGYFQYSSHVTQLFWTPHHALGGWAAIAAYQNWRAGRLPALLAAPLWVASFFWSPLAAAGAVPFLAFALACDLRDGKVRAADFASAAAAGLAALPAAAFLTRDSGAIEKGFMDFTDPNLQAAYVSLLGFKAAPWLLVAWLGRDPADRRALTELSLLTAVLLAIPFYKIGFANDFAMRASIPALALLCLRSVPALATMSAQPVARRAMLASVVALGAVTPAVETARNFTRQASPRSACNVLESLKDGPYAGSPLDYYIASAASFDTRPALFRGPSMAPLSVHIRRCWPGRRFVYGPPSAL